MPGPAALSLKLPFAEAIAQAAGRGVTLPEDYYGRLPAEARSQAFTVSGLTSLEQLQAVLDSLADALRSGQTFRDWQAAVADDLGMLSASRQELIFRNAVQTGYNIGRTTQQRENQARRPFYLWDAINDTRTRPAHAAMDGYIAPMDDEIWNSWSAPAGWNCRCTRIALSEAQARARGYGTQERPNAKPDPGWDYEKADGQGDVLARLLAQRAATMPPAVQAAVQTIATPVPVPHGTPVADALVMPKATKGLPKEMGEALRIIDELHGDGALPKIPAITSRSNEAAGWYNWDSAGHSRRLAVSMYSPHPRLTFAHEVGHFLDHKGWGGKGFASVNAPAAEVWRKSVLNSPEVMRLMELRTQATTAQMRKDAVYYTSFEEMWARSYAQWVTLRSGDAKMAEGLTNIKATSHSEARRLSQWGTVEFEPIAKAIDDLFTMLGWRHP